MINGRRQTRRKEGQLTPPPPGHTLTQQSSEIFQMAERPVFIPWLTGLRLVKEVSFSFQWNPGFAPVQKKKNIRGLHEAARTGGYTPLLEISTKSEVLLGQRLEPVINFDRIHFSA